MGACFSHFGKANADVTSSLRRTTCQPRLGVIFYIPGPPDQRRFRVFVRETADERARFAMVRSKTKRMPEDRRYPRPCCSRGAPLFVSSGVTHCVFSLSILHVLRAQSHHLRQVPRITRSYVVELTRVFNSIPPRPNWHSSCSYWPVRAVETLRSRACRGSN